MQIMLWPTCLDFSLLMLVLLFFFWNLLLWNFMGRWKVLLKTLMPRQMLTVYVNWTSTVVSVVDSVCLCFWSGSSYIPFFQTCKVQQVFWNNKLPRLFWSRMSNFYSSNISKREWYFSNEIDGNGLWAVMQHMRGKGEKVGCWDRRRWVGLYSKLNRIK